jgi:hypothetical protein
MFNSLADSIRSGSKNHAAAWKCVKDLGSPEGQAEVDKAGLSCPRSRRRRPSSDQRLCGRLVHDAGQRSGQGLVPPVAIRW